MVAMLSLLVGGVKLHQILEDIICVRPRPYYIFQRRQFIVNTIGVDAACQSLLRLKLVSTIGQLCPGRYVGFWRYKRTIIDSLR
jgi:hypothetical protein